MEQKEVVSGEQILPQDADPLQRSIEAFLRRWLEGYLPPCLFRTLFQCLDNMAPWVHTMIPVETIGSQDVISPDTLFQHAKKRMGMLIRFLLAFVPSRFQWVWGYFLEDTMAGNLIPEGTLGKKQPFNCRGINNPLRKGISSAPLQDLMASTIPQDLTKEIKEMLINPSCQGSQSNQANLVQEENQCWMEAIQGVLPDEDDPEDSTYEPTESEYESDEYKSRNDTETDLEVEEKDEMMMLKEQLNQQDKLRGHAEPRELEGKELELRSSGDGSEHPGNTAASSGGQGQPLGSQAAGMATQNQESVESRPASEGPDTSLSSDSQEQWVDVSE